MTTITPFMGPNAAGDYFRLFVIIFGVIVMFQALVSAWDEMRNYSDTDAHRIAFHVMIFVTMVIAVGTEWGRLGHIITWRLPLNILLVCVGSYALWFRMPWVKDRVQIRNGYKGYMMGREDPHRRSSRATNKYWNPPPIDEYDPYDLKDEVRRKLN